MSAFFALTAISSICSAFFSDSMAIASISSCSSSARASISTSRRSISFSDSITAASAVWRMRRLPAAVFIFEAALREAELMLLDPSNTENRPSSIPIFSSALRELSWV